MKGEQPGSYVFSIGPYTSPYGKWGDSLATREADMPGKCFTACKLVTDLLAPTHTKMLEQISIFTRGGLELFSKRYAAVKGDPFNGLVNHLVERPGDAEFTYTPPLGGGAYTVKWTLNNKLGVVFALVYQKGLTLPYSADALLTRVAKAFAKQYAEFDERETFDFDATFDALLRDAEETKGREKNAAGGTATGKSRAKPTVGNTSSAPASTSAPAPAPAPASAPAPAPAPTDASLQAFNADLLNKKFRDPKSKASKAAKASSSKAPEGTATKPVKAKGKKARDWSELDGIHRGDDEGELEFVEGAPAEEAMVVESFAKASRVDADSSDDAYDSGDSESDSDDDRGKRRGFLGSFVRNLGVSMVGTDALKRPDINPSLEELKKKLMERNVAEDIATKVVDSVGTSLVGSKLGSFSRVSSAVREAMEEALTRILTPRKPIDILRGINEAKARGRPYVIAFVGVNGVGKSTSLAKVAYYLKQHDHRVMVAACDTFRSGAVEQVKVHSQRLGLSLYARGYEKDPAKVAGEAIRAAQKEACDVVLVDTAGRMQNNEPLMRAITSLVATNNPDLVLFVGEALAGNDSVDQLVHFNKALATYSTQPNPHVIDGLIISKFETVDEKIGTAISMVFSSGAPIVFLGVGQQYTDLKKLDIRKLVRTLLK